MSVVERLGANAGGQETAKEKEKKVIQADADETKVLEAWGRHESKVPNTRKDQEERNYPPPFKSGKILWSSKATVLL